MILTARSCDAQGVLLAEGAPPPPRQEQAADDWSPFESRLEFELADILYTRCQMPGVQIDALLDIWAASLIQAGDRVPFSRYGNKARTPDHRDVYNTIDHIELGDVKWDNFTVRYTGDRPANDAPPWMEDEYEVWFRNPHGVVKNILGNPDFSTEMDYRPYREFDSASNERQWCDFMSGDWAWSQAVSH